jgi:FtsH-binding integral membrane protein
MLTLWQDLIVLIAMLAAALLFMILLNRLWPHERRRVNNDLIGWQLTIVGTTYAVILGFMLYTVWTAYSEAQLNFDLEADALRTVYRLSSGLPEPQRAQLQQLSRDYAEAVITRDFPEMAQGEPPEGSHAINEAMWETIMTVKADTPTSSLFEQQATTELASLTQHRRVRVLQTVYKLPAIFWAVLIVGAVVTITSAATFGAGSPRLHAFQVTSLTLIVTLVLLAIADVNLPYQGWVHVSNYAFVRALQYMMN